jgi:hypothetical protein
MNNASPRQPETEQAHAIAFRDSFELVTHDRQDLERCDRHEHAVDL